MNERAASRIARRASRCAALAVSSSLAACVSTSLPPLHEAKRPFALEDDEAGFWRQARATAERLDAQRIEDPAIETYLGGIVSRLLGEDRERLEALPRVRVLPAAELNAFALPDGSIYLYSDLVPVPP